MLKNARGETLKVPDPMILEYNLKKILNSEVLQLPRNYIVFDLETTGLSPSKNNVWQIGLLPIMHGTAVGAEIGGGESIYLALPEEQLRQATFEIGRRRAVLLDKVHDPCEKIDRLTDEAYHQAEEQFINEVQSKGVDPVEGLRTFTEILQTFIDLEYPIVGQNSIAFDVPFIEFSCKQCGINFKFPQERMIDTSVLIKSAILKRQIMTGETSRKFGARISEERAKGCFSALSRFAIPFFELDTRYGIDLAKAHDAAYDCMITDLLLKNLVDWALGTCPVNAEVALKT